MPRCGSEANILRPPNTTTVDIDLSTPGGAVQLQGAVVFRVLRGEWHPIDTSGGTVVIHTETDLPYSQMDLAVQWPPQSGSTSAALYLPSSSGVDSRALDGLGTLFGIPASRTGTYTGSISVPGIAVAWKAYSCLLGDELPDGTKLTEVIMTGADDRVIRGGWVFTEPGTSSPSTGPSEGGGSSSDGTWLTLPANRFAIIGGTLGALFGTGRLLFFQSGVSNAFRTKVRSEFGFAASEGADAQIRVKDYGYDFLLEVTPV